MKSVRLLTKEREETYMKRLFVIAGAMALMAGSLAMFELKAGAEKDLFVCHKPGGTGSHGKIVAVSAGQVDRHLSHGDYIYNPALNNGITSGECPSSQ
jgi:hypothetical protein